MDTIITGPLPSAPPASGHAADPGAASESYHTPSSSIAQVGSVPDSEAKLTIVALKDLEAEAEKVMPAYAYAYVSGGAGDEWTMRENRAAFDRWVICANSLAGHKDVDLTTTLLGTPISYPVITAALGNQGSVHARMEAPMVEGTAHAGTIFVESSVSQMSLEAVASASAGPKWFQIYVPESRPFAVEMLHRAKDAGFTAIVVTVDTKVFSNRERSTRLLGAPMPRLAMGIVPITAGVTGSATRSKMDLNWDDIEFCGRESGLPVIVKSILSVEDALEAKRRGCAGVWLSNHGGRQLDHVASAITTLPAVAAALEGKLTIIVDGGVYRGQDVFRALALGADAVALGRPLLYGSALGGAGGVQSVHDHLKKELAMVMRLAGTPTIASITSAFVTRAEHGALPQTP